MNFLRMNSDLLAKIERDLAVKDFLGKYLNSRFWLFRH